MYYQRVPTFEAIRTEYLGNAKVIVEPRTVLFGKKSEQSHSPELNMSEKSESSPPELKNIDKFEPNSFEPQSSEKSLSKFPEL